MDNQTIREAVNLWTFNKEQAIEKYGHISTWQTREVVTYKHEPII